MAEQANGSGWLALVGGSLPALSSVDSWESFCVHWWRLTSEEAAIGMLYAGAKLLRKIVSGSRDREKATQIVAQAVDLYLRYAGQEEQHPELARAAKQVLIGKIVRARLVDTRNPLLFQTHMSLLRFLTTPDRDILETPNPNSVLEYLLGLSKEWTGEDRPNPEMHKLLQAHGKLIIRTMLEWGWADYVEGDYQPPLVIETIREYLTVKYLDWNTPEGHQLLSYWMDRGRPDTDTFSLAEPNAGIWGISRAYAKLFKLAWIETLSH